MPAPSAPAARGSAAVLPPGELQQQLEVLYSLAPRLCPVVRPKGMDDQGMAALAKREPDGNQGLQKLQMVVDAAGKTCQACAFCGHPGEAGSGEAEYGKAADPATLQFATDWHLDFAKKTMRLHRGQFACGLCRACMDLSGWVALAAAGENSALADERSMMMRTLCSHMVEVNSPAGIDSSNELAATAWAQEVYALAYSFHVIASNVRGWQILDCDGVPLSYRKTGGAAAAAAQRCLPSAVKPKGKKRSDAGGAAPEQTPVGNKKKKHALGVSKTRGAVAKPGKAALSKPGNKKHRQSM
eukprot:jgi/Tetstr1/423562/TSEL_014235.t1